MGQEEMYHADIEHVKKTIGKNGGDIEDIQKALYTLIEAQKNTTRNVDSLSADVKGMLKTTLNFSLIEKEIAHMEERVKHLEDHNSWGMKLIVGAVFTAIIGLIFGIKSHIGG